MNEIDRLIRVPAAILGGIVLMAPTVLVVLYSRRAKGRVSGRGMGLRNGLGVSLMTIAFVGIGILLWKPIPIEMPSWLEFLFTAAGALLYFGGVGLYLWGLVTIRSQFGVSSLFGAELYREHALVTDGPFALVRHPMYAGVLLAAPGALLIFRTWAMVIFVPMSLVVLFRAEREEKLLEQEFGEEWKTYASKVAMWIPRLW